MKDHSRKPNSELFEGAKVGRFRIIKQIGTGGMGDVYLAEDADLKRRVALKFLSLSLNSDPDCKARFMREAQAAAKLNHPATLTWDNTKRQVRTRSMTIALSYPSVVNMS